VGESSQAPSRRVSRLFQIRFELNDLARHQAVAFDRQFRIYSTAPDLEPAFLAGLDKLAVFGGSHAVDADPSVEIGDGHQGPVRVRFERGEPEFVTAFHAVLFDPVYGGVAKADRKFDFARGQKTEEIVLG